MPLKQRIQLTPQKKFFKDLVVGIWIKKMGRVEPQKHAKEEGRLVSGVANVTRYWSHTSILS